MLFNNIPHYQDLQPFYIGGDGNNNPFYVNYKWYQKMEIKNRDPNRFIFNKIKEFE